MSSEEVRGPMEGAARPTATETAVLGGGCFWCTEAVFAELAGVRLVEPGYAGGTVRHPTYEQVCEGDTGHAEVVRVTLDPTVLSYADLLRIFFTIHDPTTPDRQGADVGPQYRSIILYASDSQRATAESVRQEIDAARLWARPLVTEVRPLAEFFPAEAYHREYFRRHPDRAYCRLVIEPKVAKFRHQFQDRLARSRRA
jgi:peptide-methionine (S)-S-oxide reductase